jgi:hypothetical protein
MPLLPLFLMFIEVLGLVMFFLAWKPWPTPPAYNLIAGGLFCWLLADIISRGALLAAR